MFNNMSMLLNISDCEDNLADFFCTTVTSFTLSEQLVHKLLNTYLIELKLRSKKTKNSIVEFSYTTLWRNSPFATTMIAGNFV